MILDNAKLAHSISPTEVSVYGHVLHVSEDTEFLAVNSCYQVMSFTEKPVLSCDKKGWVYNRGDCLTRGEIVATASRMIGVWQRSLINLKSLPTPT